MNGRTALVGLVLGCLLSPAAFADNNQAAASAIDFSVCVAAKQDEFPAAGLAPVVADKTSAAGPVEYSYCGKRLPANPDVDVEPLVGRTDLIIVRFIRDGKLLKLKETGLKDGNTQVSLLGGAASVNVPVSAEELKLGYLRITLADAALIGVAYKTPIQLTIDLGTQVARYYFQWSSEIKPYACVANQREAFPPSGAALSEGIVPQPPVPDESVPPEQRFCGARLYDPADQPLNEQAFVSKDDLIIVRYKRDNDLITPQSAGVAEGSDSVSLSSGGNTVSIPVTNGMKREKYLRLNLNRLDIEKLNITHGTQVKIVIMQNARRLTISFRWKRRLVPYGFAGVGYGIWFPIGLFSTNFKVTDSGVAFAALPVGIAVGGKVMFGNGHYIGGSVMGNWLIHDQTDANGKPNGNVNLASLTVGGLIDIDNLLYLGYAYGIDFAKGDPMAPMPGHMAVFGVAPGLLNILKSKMQ